MDLISTDWRDDAEHILPDLVDLRRAIHAEPELGLQNPKTLAKIKAALAADKKYWGVSWRYAGGIVANMCEIGDYIDWYCSGMISKERINQVKWDSMSYEQQVRALQNQKFVSEGVISEQVLEDLNVLGWAPVFSDD